MNNRHIKIQTPSRLTSLSGARSPGENMMVGKSSKAPKLRFKIGDKFQYDDGKWPWEIIYAFRLINEPSIWYYCIEEQVGEKTENRQFIETGIIAIGAGATTPRIVFNPFRNSGDASQYFSDIYRRGDSAIKSTQELLKLKKLV